MGLIDFLFNLAALALWLNWLSLRNDSQLRTSAISLVGTLRKADATGPKRWKFLLGLAALLLFRAIFYWEFCPVFQQTPRLDLGAINLFFRSNAHDWLGRMLLYSLVSFAATLGVFYLFLLALSIANIRFPDSDPFQRMIRLHLRWVENWPVAFKILLPLFIGALFWIGFYPLLQYLHMLRPIRNLYQLGGQSLVIGLGTYLDLKYLIAGILLLHVVNSYVYLGNHHFWNYVNGTAQHFLFPLRWLPLRLGKMDFLPLVMIALVFFLAEIPERPPAWPPWFRPWFYHHLLPF